MDKTKEFFQQVDKNQDGSIDKEEFRDWISKPKRFTNSSNDKSSSRYDQHTHKTSYENDLERKTDRYTSYEAAVSASDVVNGAPIHTGSVEETKRYLENAINVCKDLNPKIIRRAATENPMTSEQRIQLRYLQPPALPPPEPLIIKEVRAEQPPNPPPIVIREQPRSRSTPPPLILRERPPIPPPRIPGEIRTRVLPAIPIPPRSIIIERFPPPPEKPRDIIIERWIPYGPQPERQTIVQPASAPIEYPKPSHTIVIHDDIPVRIVRKLEKLGISQEDPDSYVARYGASLLESTTLVQEARNAGVLEDISPPMMSLFANQNNFVNHDRLNSVISQGFSSSRETGYQPMQQASVRERDDTIYKGYSSYGLDSIGHSGLSGSSCKIQIGVHVGNDSACNNDSKSAKLCSPTSQHHF